MFTPYPAYWYVCCGRPRPLPARVALLGGAPAAHTLVLGTGSAFIEPGLGYFAHGNPIGGPLESYRGVTASTFPFEAAIYGPGAPLSSELLGLAGAPLSTLLGRGGTPIR